MKVIKLDFGDLSNLKWVSPLTEFDLDGFVINIRLYYNKINNSLYINIYDVYDNIIAYGVKLVPNINLLQQVSYKFKKRHILMVLSAVQDHEYDDVTLENFGRGMVMCYATENVQSD